MDYSFARFDAANLVKLDILINGDRVDALASIVHRDQAQTRGRSLAEKMKELIPRQMFDVALQAAIGEMIARQTVKALRKNVTAKCYGGDITRRKTVRKTERGQEAHETAGSVEIQKRFGGPEVNVVGIVTVHFVLGGAGEWRHHSGRSVLSAPSRVAAQ